MDIHKIEILMQAIENGSLLSTATQLGYTQAGLSHMMKSLESELGLVLLRRGKFGIQLTEEGQRLIPIFEGLISLNKKLTTEVELILQQKASIIRLASISSVIRTWLPDIILAFQREHPDVSFEIKESDDRMYQWVDRGSIDICITSNMIAREDFVPLMKDEFFACLPEDYAIEEGEKFSLKQIEIESFICSSCGNDYDVERILKDYNIHPKKQNTYVDDNNVISMVSKGFGISILPGLVLEKCHESVKIVQLDLPCFREIGMLYNKSISRSPALAKFVAFLEKWSLERRGEKNESIDD